MLYDLMVPFLAFVAITSLGGAVLTARGPRRGPVRARLGGLEGTATEPETFGLRGLFRRDLERIATAASVGSPSARLKEELAKAGYYTKSAARIYLGVKSLLFVVGIIGSMLLLLPTDTSFTVTVVLVAGGATMLSTLPNLVVHLRRRRRAEDIRHHLPDALDLLEICVSSGMGLDMAWNAVASEVRGVSATLADELALTNLELHLGAPRAAAMRRMAQRTGADEMASLVALLIQSERFGTSVGDALRTFAASMRERRSQRAAEAAEKMAVKLLFPMAVFIFPTILIVAAGPACVVLSEVMGWK